MRLMNLSANKKFDKETQQREWYNFYNDGLGKFGWTLTGAAHVEEAIEKDTHTLATLVPQIVNELKRLGADDIGTRAAAVEFALEGLYLARRIAKHDADDGTAVYSR